jgi:hypothetical protein
MEDNQKQTETTPEKGSMFSFLSSRKSGNDTTRISSSDTLDKNAAITSNNIETSYESDISSGTSSGSGTSSSLKGYLPDFSLTTIMLIIISLALLGFNIFSYLSDATETTGDFLKPIVDKVYTTFGYAVTDTAKTTINVSAKGAKLGVDVAAGTLTSAIDTTQEVALDKDSETPHPVDDEIQVKKNIKKVVVTSDDSQSVFQKSNSSSKTGWCFIGEDKGVRSCIDVAKGDTCISKNIFPSRDICMNPSLRE